MFQLMREASEMLRDRTPEERDLIYAIACLEDEYRGAVNNPSAEAEGFSRLRGPLLLATPIV